MASLQLNLRPELIKYCLYPKLAVWLQQSEMYEVDAFFIRYVTSIQICFYLTTDLLTIAYKVKPGV